MTPVITLSKVYLLILCLPEQNMCPREPEEVCPGTRHRPGTLGSRRILIGPSPSSDTSLRPLFPERRVISLKARAEWGPAPHAPRSPSAVCQVATFHQQQPLPPHACSLYSRWNQTQPVLVDASKSLIMLPPPRSKSEETAGRATARPEAGDIEGDSGCRLRAGLRAPGPRVGGTRP